MIATYLVLIVGLVAMQLVWVFTDHAIPLQRARQLDPVRTGLIYGTVLLQWVSHVYFPMPPTLIVVALMPIGLVLFAAGIILCIWAKLTMRDSWGIPAQHDIQRQHTLIKHGPFRFTRNPIYVGLFMVEFGLALALGSWLFFLVYLLYMYFGIAIKKEEQLLVKHFGMIVA